MKYMIISLLCIVPSLQCCQKLPIIIRNAEVADIEHLNALSAKQYQNDFKPVWENFYAPLFPYVNVEQFIKEKTDLNNKNNEKIIHNHDPNQPSQLLVAVTKDIESLTNTIAGFCRFEKKDEKTIYINFVLVDEDFRKQGIAKKLALAAINRFPGITTCRFRAHVHNKKINEIYTQHGCIQVGAVSIDLDSGAITNDPNAPITHYDYHYSIKK